MTIEDLKKIEATENIEGEVLIDLKTLKTLVDERNGHKKDVDLIIAIIRRLLTQIGILTPQGEIQFKVSRLVKALTSALWNRDSMEEDFAYLGDLGPVIAKHTETVVDSQ